MQREHPKFRFPWREGNRFSLLIDGPEFYPRMLAAIAGAKRYVLLEMYLVESGRVTSRFVDALCEAAGRGVRVRLLFDAFGSLGLATADRLRLEQAGARLRYYNPLKLKKRLRNLARDHRKILIVDGERAYTGGAGLTDDFDPPRSEWRWRETMLEIAGPVVADWQQLFAELWRHTARDGLDTAPPTPVPVEGGMRGRVEIGHAARRREIGRALLKRLRRARERVWLSTAYFIPSWRLRRALRAAARRGVDVRVLVPGPKTDHPAVRHAGRRFFGRLLLAGVRIYEYQPRFIHSKVALCDEWVSVGSSNFDRWNLHWNLEANQTVENADFAADARRMFQADFAESIECRHGDWQRRPLRARFREYWWGKVDLWLDALGRGRAPRDPGSD